MDQITFDENGLVACVVQDWSSGEVLTLAYMNDEALKRTRETGEVHFFSRSRNRLWHKGETSGNVQRVRALRYDCDRDAVLALVEPAGPACHTGERSCFFNGDTAPTPHEALPTLVRTIAARQSQAPASSYTAQLLADDKLRQDKVREEADEVVRAAAAESDERLRAEAADLVYHVGVLLQARGVSFAEVFEELNARRR